MLAPDLKDQIQSLYRQLLKSRDLTPRYGQRLMIAEVAKALGVLCEDRSKKPVAVVEAGTGTGKTLAYLLATLPLARALDLKVVIATATVALQEQVLEKDIPELQAGSDLEFSVALAKGRGRYLCLAQLDNLLRGNDSQQALMDLYGEEFDSVGDTDTALYERMLEALNRGDWDGERDSWSEALRESDWRPLTVDNTQCTGARCSHFRSCYFFRARDNLAKADCIVSNQDLVLADLALGGGVILPEPESCLYIFDEAHHLPLKSNSHFAYHTRLRATTSWLERSDKVMENLRQEDLIDATEAGKLQQRLTSLMELSGRVWLMLEELLEQEGEVEQYEDALRMTFELGVVPAELQSEAAELAAQFSYLIGSLDLALDQLKDCMDNDGDADRQQAAEQAYALVGAISRRASANWQLWQSYAHPGETDSAPTARWLSYARDTARPDISVASSPVLAASSLTDSLWQRCAGALLTSATLSALGSFEMFAMRAGLPEDSFCLSIPSPFDFARAATLVVPRLNCDPGDSSAHTAAIIRTLPALIDKNSASLMLFSSRRQMQDVLAGLEDDWRDLVLCQDDFQKSQLLAFHRQRVDRGEGSIIFGLASFAEGVDLPGKYCRHVLIARIPFAVPNDPIETTLAAWIEAQGKNPFMTLAVPDAAFRLTQASGRLLRSEKDTGQITLFDERLVTRRYGKQILDSLPAYSRQLLIDVDAVPVSAGAGADSG